MRDTPKNFLKVRAFLDKVIAKRDAGTLTFSDAFPRAPERRRMLFARQESRSMAGSKPNRLTFGAYAKRWSNDLLAQDPSMTKQHDHKRILQSRILPYFKDMSFADINGVEVKRFILQLRHKKGPKAGQQLAGSTIRNTLSVLRAVWYDACEEHGWDISDPFQYLSRPNNRRVIPARNHEAPQVFRYDEWDRLREAMEPHYLPIVEMMVMTGMIASEIAALRSEDVHDGKIHVRRSLTLGIEKESLKTDFRRRAIPVTREIEKLLDKATPDAKGKYLFSMASGKPFDADNFRKNAWRRALEGADILYRVPYSTKHTFAAWALTIGMHPERLVRLMGHSTKKMVYETYGKYVEGLESDGEPIRSYFGKDFS